MIPGTRLIRTPEKYNIRTEARLSAYINANVTQFQAELDQVSYCRVAVARAGAMSSPFRLLYRLASLLFFILNEIPCTQADHNPS